MIKTKRNIFVNLEKRNLSEKKCRR